MTTFPAQSLASSAEMTNAVKTGLADIGLVPITMNTATYRISGEIFTLPTIDWPVRTDRAAHLKTSFAIGQLFDKMRAEFPEFAAELAYAQYLPTGFWPVAAPVLSKKQIRASGDLAGVKMAAIGLPATWMGGLGATAVPLPPTEYYTSAQTGLINAAAVPNYQLVFVYKLWEVFDYAVPNASMMAGLPIMMNTAKWNALPKDLQDLLVKVFTEGAVQFVGAGYDETDLGIQGWAKAGKTTITLTSAEKAAWQASAKATEADWIAKKEAAGIKSAAAMVTRVKELVAALP